MLFVILFCIGAIVGSFLNVCIVRLPAEESVVFPRSHCRSCRKPIAWYDNIPIVSFLLLRGRCRACGKAIAFRYPIIEFVTACLFALFYALFGFSAVGVVYLALSLALLVESAIDLDHQIIPDEITLPGIVLGFAASALFPELHGVVSRWDAARESLVGIVVGGGTLYLAGAIAERILKKEAMGGGDVKLLAMIGALLGWRGVAWTVFFSSFLGSAVGIYPWLKKGGERIPYGPYLAAAAFFYLFFGQNVIEWYANAMLRLAG